VLLPVLWFAGGVALAVPAACVCNTIELVTPSYWLGKTSRLAGENVQEVWFGNPEHDKVINAGVPPDAGTKDELGVTVIVPVPAWPAVRVFEGARLDTVTTNGVEHCELTVCETAIDADVLYVALPA
jgi:hypothetical protein